MTISILLIDDSISFVVQLTQALDGTGDFDAIPASTPDAAHEALRTHHCDLAVIDFGLPGMDVMELVRLLRSVQPDLPIIVTPSDDLEGERAQFMDVQGVVSKPYSARDLIPHIHDVLRRLESGDLRPPQASVERPPHDEDDAGPPAPPEGAALLEEFEELERAQTALLSDQSEESDDSTRLLDDEEPAPPVTTAFLQWDTTPEETRTLHDTDHLEDDDHDAPQEPGVTRLLDDDDSQASDTTALLEWTTPEETRKLQETDELRRRKRPGPPEPHIEEPPVLSGDTPSVPVHDYDGMPDFFPDTPDSDAEDFDDVLDAVAHTPDDRARSPEDREFHDLVESLRTPDLPRPRRTRLEELLASIASDAGVELPSDDDEDALDYVFDAIRRSQPQSGADAPEGESADDESAGDATIGDVIDGLFDPAFEGVLAALAGEDIEDADIEEPTYEEPRHAWDEDAPESIPEDDHAEAMEGEAVGGIEPPETLPEMPGEPREPREPGPVIVEPPIEAEDSSRYPATAALNAVSAEEEGDFSLDDLLSQIEQELPPARDDRPRLKPLPSWEREGLLDGASALAKMFDHVEGVRGPEAPTVDESPPFEEEDTRPSAALIDVAPPPTDSDTRPAGPDTGIDISPLPEVTEQEPEELLTIDDLLARAELPPEAPTGERQEPDAVMIEPTDAEIEAVFFESVGREPEPESLPEAAQEAAHEAAQEAAQESVEDEGEAARDDEQWEDFDVQGFDLEAEELIPMSLDEATQRIETYAEEDEEPRDQPVLTDDADIARAAVQLTQYALESSAQLTLLSRSGELLAYAGHVDEDTTQTIFERIDRAWSESSATSDALIRFVPLPDGGEYLVYSALIGDDQMTLTMAFHANTSLSLIRRQARRLSESLDLVPVQDETTDETLPSRPTEMTPPPGLQQQVGAAPDDLPPRPKSAEDETYTGYTALWMPNDPGVELIGSFADALYNWIYAAADAAEWELDTLDVQADYVRLTVSTPQKLSPDEVIGALMRETAQRTWESFPDVARHGALWTDGYYLVTPPRDLTDREIMRITTVQRNAQLNR